MAFEPAECPEDCAFRRTINGWLPMCGYLHTTGEIRGCDPGPGCTRYSIIRPQIHTQDKHKGKDPTWDVATGRKMWSEGYTDAQIGKMLGVSRQTVAAYRTRKWGELNPQRQRRLY